MPPTASAPCSATPESPHRLQLAACRAIFPNRTGMPAGQLPSPPPRRAWSGLQFRMAVSYALTTLAAVLLIEILAGATIWVSVSRGPLAGAFNARVKQIAAVYALAAARSD